MDANALRELIESRDARNGQDLLESVGGLSQLAERLSSSLKFGLLTEESAARNKVIYGSNVFPAPPPTSFLRLLLGALKDRTLIMLMIAAAVNIILGMTTEDVRTGWIDGVAILVAVMIVALVTSCNDYSKELQFRKLNQVAESRHVQVLRSGRPIQVNIADVVVGDVTIIGTGDSLPADGLLIAGEEFQVDESTMTGESEASVKELRSDVVLLANTKVVAGTGRMLVVAVGPQSQWGRLKSMLRPPTTCTPLQETLAALAERIGLIGTACAVLIFVTLFLIWLIRNYLIEHRHWQWKQLLEVNKFFLAAVGLLVMAVPEGLPLSVTLSLSYSMRRMMQDNCLVRKLEACETMGGATQICSDKTGTLTENRMSVVSLWTGYSEPGVLPVSELFRLPDAFVQAFVEIASINSSASWSIDPSSLQRVIVGNKTEGALLQLLEQRGLDYMMMRQRAVILKRVPFSSEAKLMATFMALSDGRVRTLCTGAPDVIIPRCTNYLGLDGKRGTPIDPVAALLVCQQMATQGLRVLALSSRDAPASDPLEPQDLTLVCLLGIKDKLRDDVTAAVHQCQTAGVTVRMLTGDSRLTAESIAKECGILRQQQASHTSILEGSEFRSLSDEQVRRRLPEIKVLARCSPTDKYRLVQLLRESGEVVAVTGDGTNDAPQLNEADVGFSMGSGTEVAKDASDIVILNDSFSAIVSAMKWGRNVYCSIQKFLQFQLTVTTVAIVIAFVGSVIWHESPLSAIQMLWVNVIMDSFASLALATEPPNDDLLLRPPRSKNENIITRKMARFIVGSAALQLYVLIGLMYGAQLIPWFRLPDVVRHWTDHDRRVQQTITFNCFVLLQLFNLFNARKLENEVNIFSGLHRNWLFWVIILLCCIGQALLESQTVALTGEQWLGCIGVASVMLPWGILLRFMHLPDARVEHSMHQRGDFIHQEENAPLCTYIEIATV